MLTKTDKVLVMRWTKTEDERFCEKLDVSGTCLGWLGHKNRAGYGWFFSGDREVYAHRWMYETIHGRIPDGLEIDHLCSNRWCVLPDHLELVTHAENMRRSRGNLGRGAARRAMTHCKRGHEFTEENTYNRPPDYRRRVCRACLREGYHRRKRGA